jgi:hypothetical protein
MHATDPTLLANSDATITHSTPYFLPANHQFTKILQIFEIP